MTKLIVATSVAVAIAHFLLIAHFYHSMPPMVPAFVALDGRSLVALRLSPLAACRLPLMGLVTQVACWAMAFQAGPRLWSTVSLLVGCKLFLSSLDLVLPHSTAPRVGVIAVSMLAILVLLRTLKAPDLQRPSGRTKATLALCLVAYLALVVMPWWLR